MQRTSASATSQALVSAENMSNPAMPNRKRRAPDDNLDDNAQQQNVENGAQAHAKPAGLGAG